jgi:hypothetical protein
VNVSFSRLGFTIQVTACRTVRVAGFGVGGVVSTVISIISSVAAGIRYYVLRAEVTQYNPVRQFVTLSDAPDSRGIFIILIFAV